jgi:hypothetical protein
MLPVLKIQILLRELLTDMHLFLQFSTKSQGFAFYAVTRPVRIPHPNLQGREEDKARL